MENKEIKLDVREVMVRLAKLQASMDYIKEHIEDTTLTEDDISSIKKAKHDLREGKTRRL